MTAISPRAAAAKDKATLAQETMWTSAALQVVFADLIFQARRHYHAANKRPPHEPGQVHPTRFAFEMAAHECRNAAAAVLTVIRGRFEGHDDAHGLLSDRSRTSVHDLVDGLLEACRTGRCPVDDPVTGHGGEACQARASFEAAIEAIDDQYGSPFLLP